MSTAKPLNLTQATMFAEMAIDTIISQGADRLYDNYIKTKIPKNIRNSLEKVIENVFNPFTDNNCNNTTEIKRIHQSEIKRSKLVDEKKKKHSLLGGQDISDCFRIRNTIDTEKRSIKDKVNKEETIMKKCHQRKRQIKASSACVPNFTQSSNSFQEQQQIDQKWAQRQKRLNEQLLRESQQKKAEQKSLRLKKRLQQQIRQLQENKKTITFNHHTGRIFHLEEHHQFDNQNNKIHKNIIRIKFGLSDNEDPHHKTTETKQSFVKSSRKITSFQRKGKKFNFIDEEVNDKSYNNNGKRQTSNIPFLQAQQGVNISEGNKLEFNNNENRNIRSRVNSASLTHRTFKSYTKEKMQSSRCVKTIATATTTGKTRYHKGQEQYQTKIDNGTKQSILWSCRGAFKNHKISKNVGLMENYFSLGEQC